MFSRAFIVRGILGSNKEESEGDGFRRVSRTVTWIRGICVLLEFEVAVSVVTSLGGVGNDALASLAAEIKERPIRITELSSPFSLRSLPLSCREGLESSSSSSSSSPESVKYESISRNSARIFEFLILFPVNHNQTSGVVLNRDQRVDSNPR